MSYEEEFDRLMREKAEGVDHPFDESHWQKASKMISESRIRAGYGPVAKLVLGTVAVAGIVAAVLYTSQTPDTKLQRAQVATIASTEIDKPAEQELSVPAQNVSGKAAEEVVAEPVNIARPSAPPSIQYEEVASKPAPVEAAQPAAEEGAAPAAVNKQPEMAMTPERAAPAEVSAPVYENKNVLAEPGSAEPVAAEPAKQEQSAIVAETSGRELSVSEFLDNKSVFLEYRASEPEADLAALAVVKARDDDYYDKKKKPLTFYLDLNGGAAYQAGWLHGNERDGRGPGWYGGLSAGYFLCRSMSIGSGIQAFNLGHITQPFYTVRSKNYDFGSVTSKTLITCSQLQYVAVPLRLSYHFKGGSQFSLGFYAAQLMRAHNTVESSQTLDNSVINKTTSKNYDLYDGMTQQVFMASAGYSLRVCTRFFVSAEIVYGLNELYTVETYAKSIEKPTALRLGLTYRIFEK